jgi:HTH-type transcriptional regulator/antitoxin HipB
MSVMKDITLRNAEQLGTAIRLKRKEKGLSQTAFAEQLGVGRKWIIQLEAGHPKAEFGVILKALRLLNIDLRLIDLGAPTNRPAAEKSSRLDEVFQRLQRDRK